MQGFGLEDGTPVKLRTARTISSADAHAGDTLDFEVLEDVFANSILVVPKGGIAWGAQLQRRNLNDEWPEVESSTSILIRFGSWTEKKSHFGQ